MTMVSVTSFATDGESSAFGSVLFIIIIGIFHPLLFQFFVFESCCTVSVVCDRIPRIYLSLLPLILPSCEIPLTRSHEYTFGIFITMSFSVDRGLVVCHYIIMPVVL